MMKEVVARTCQIPADPQQWPAAPASAAAVAAAVAAAATAASAVAAASTVAAAAAAAEVHRAGFCDDNRQSRLRLRAIPLHQTVRSPLYHYNGTILWPRASLPR